MKRNTITEVTRRAIFDAIEIHNIDWYGRLDEIDFLSRIFDLGAMKSTDRRLSTAEADIRQHCINWNDWPSGWIFTDSRFNLLRCDDELLLRFLCEMVHPVVRSDPLEAESIVDYLNSHLRHDGWEILSNDEISGRPVFAPQRILDDLLDIEASVSELETDFDDSYLLRQITRMQSSVRGDPELAIGTAKEFLETICKSVLKRRGVSPPNDELPSLVRATLSEISILNDDAISSDGRQALKRLIGNLAGLGQSVGEVRNRIGTGHGKPMDTAHINPMFAHLVVGAATSLGVFLYRASFSE